MNTSSPIRDALAAERYETARRLALRHMAAPEGRDAATILALHDALIALADFQGARKLLEDNASAFAGDPFTLALKLAEDFHTLANEGHYRLSEETKQGYSVDEYLTKYRALARAKFEEAQSLASGDAHKAALIGSRPAVQLGLIKASDANTSDAKAGGSANVSGAMTEAHATCGRVQGTLVWPDGSPVAGATVTLGLKLYVSRVNPATYTLYGMHYSPTIGEQDKRTAPTAADGTFTILDVPPGTHDFLAVTLDPARFEIATRFLARDIAVSSQETTGLGRITVKEWQSAAPLGFEALESRAAAAEAALASTEGAAVWTTVSRVPLRNPFHYNFPQQLLRLPFPVGIDLSKNEFRIVAVTDGDNAAATVLPSQSVLPESFGLPDAPPSPAAEGTPTAIAFLASLPAKSELSLAIQARATTSAAAGKVVDSLVNVTGVSTYIEEDGTLLTVDTGPAAFRFSWGATTYAPIRSMRGVDGVWRGNGRFVLPKDVSVSKAKTYVRQAGPVLLELGFDYTLSNGALYSLSVTLLAGQAYLVVRETSAEVPGAAFEFSLRELSGGRGFLHWTPEAGGFHWSTLKAADETIALLPESVPWWIPPQGFGYAMTPEGLEHQDYIAVVTLRRGTWVDRKFERIAQGPIDAAGRENRELDWPYPEMVGSSISPITAHTCADGDAFFRFAMFDGARSWGLLVSTLERNDGPWKEIAAVQHSNSSPRLQEFKDWHLDVADTVARPNGVIKRSQLFSLREKTRSKRLGRVWSKIANQEVRGPVEGLSFAVQGDPLVAWRKRAELAEVAPVRSKMILLGRDWSDVYSPVGGRSITQWAEDYDMLAASGVFSDEEERELRAFFILMGHMFMEEDFMNWRFNARNANFEADRTDIIGTIGVVFDGHPDAPKFVDHTIERTHKALGVYCTPGSGKWYENPACYYLHASKCRMNLVYHLAKHGRLDVAQIPRLKEFLRWGIVLLTPPQPVSYEVMREGDAAWYESTEKVRKVPPIGDHACLGRWIPEHYFFIGKLFQKSDPAFAKEMIDAYFCGSGDGLRVIDDSHAVDQEGEHIFHEASSGAAFGNLCLFFATAEEADIPVKATQIELESRRLEGFGAVLRSEVNSLRENYILIKQGPGGYRFHRTEGSILFFAQGKPLVYDGGEAGETWRHSTLSFFDTHMPLSAGHVERILVQNPENSPASEGSEVPVHPAYQFVQGVHPEIIRPGEPVFLSDTCRHELVEEAYRRLAKPNPAVARSYAWVGDRYLVIHDALDLPAADADIPVHWHLQVVADESDEERDGAEAVALANASGGRGYRFAGRHGLDLAVALPGQTFAAESITQDPILEYRSTPEQRFAMRHLQLSQPGMRSALAVLLPVAAGEKLDLHAEALYPQDVSPCDKLIGTHVRTKREDDYIFFAHKGLRWHDVDVSFEGCYGAAMRRVEADTLVLTGAGSISLGNDQGSGFSVQSVSSQETFAADAEPGAVNVCGPNVMLTRGWQSALLTAEGCGRVRAVVFGKTLEAEVKGSGRWVIAADKPVRGAQIFLREGDSAAPQRLARVALRLDSAEEVDKLHRQMAGGEGGVLAEPVAAGGAYGFTARDKLGNMYRIFHGAT
ncbi:hypothetical protein DB346_02755 [Verrucomicrobia bacterium LW23]|nr:hypothetical protein DB346_03900 [Verrucomicrobia bacterium LW23]PTY04368.1 hypothetical protein DB346_02755 [Verrucomicrobia bacterium LW23]